MRYDFENPDYVAQATAEERYEPYECYSAHAARMMYLRKNEFDDEEYEEEEYDDM